MNHYVDIKLLPDGEVSEAALMNYLAAKLHRLFCLLQHNRIGVSFPKQDKTLGDLLRLHGDLEDLGKLQKANWIGGMMDYCVVGEPTPIPSGVKFRTVSRKQRNVSSSKLRRLIKRGSCTDGDEAGYREKMRETKLRGPYLELVSASTGHKYRRYIRLGDLVDSPVLGGFDNFGLSTKATVPWF